MYCRYCGRNIAEDSEFCTYCGKSIRDNSNINYTTQEIIRDVKPNAPRTSFAAHLPLIVNTLCYIALGTFLFFNIKMAPFYGWWKVLAYIIEAAIAICLTVLTNNKISESKFFGIKALSIIFSILIIISSITLRVVYECKVDAVEKDIPTSGTILVYVSQDTDYASYTGGFIHDPSTTIRINGFRNYAKVTLGRSTNLKIKVEGNGRSGSTSDTIVLQASDFVNRKYSITQTVHLDGGIRATVEVTLKRYCTFWEVIFY